MMSAGLPKPKAYSYLRMSTDLQLKGDSRRRQLEKSQAYAERNGLELLDGAQLEDIGVSAFKGDNVSDGALGRFLEAVEKGVIPPGSYFLVESLDRLSRQEVLKSLALFLRIVQAGINLVTLDDERIYRGEATDFADLLISLTIMSRAHEESRTKSNRVAAAWKNKRVQAAAARPMTKICPAWLRLSDDRAKYVIIENRAEVVRSIFHDAANGIGIYSITRRLNEQNEPTFNISDGWHASYISKILNNRAAIGEFQPHSRAEGRRKPDGDPISGYYPAIIDEETFYRAQQGRSERLVSGRGRKGQHVSNLFSGLAKCAHCRGPIKYESKGSGPKGGQYLVCERGKRHLGCVTTRWRYSDFESSFLTFVRELDLQAALSDTKDARERQRVDTEVTALQGKINTLRATMEKTFLLLQTGSAIEFVSSKLAEQQADLERMESDLTSLDALRKSLSSRMAGFYESRDELQALVRKIQEQANEDSFSLRSLVSAKLRDIIETLLVAPLGRLPFIQKNIQVLKAEAPEDWKDIIQRFQSDSEQPSANHPYFAIGFKDGSVRVVTPNPENPSEFELQLLSNAEAGLTMQTPLGDHQLFLPADTNA